MKALGETLSMLLALLAALVLLTTDIPEKSVQRVERWLDEDLN